MTTRETLKNFLSNIGKTSNSISYSHNKESDVQTYDNVDLGKDAQTGEELIDIDNEDTGLLGDYINYITENSNSIFKISRGIERATASKRGESLVIAEEQGAESVFVQQGTENFNNLSRYSNSGKFSEAGEQLSDFLDKTGKENNAHFLLNSIEGTNLSTSNQTLTQQEGDPSKPVQAVNSMLMFNNRFTNAIGKTAFAEKNTIIEDYENKNSESGTLKIENQFGKANINSNIISLNELKELGKSLLMKSTGYDNSLTPKDSLLSQEFINTLENDEFENFLYANDSFQKIEIDKLRAKNAKGMPVDSSGNSIRNDRGENLNIDPSANNSKSFGSSFNQEVHFSGKNKKILKLKAAIACKALTKATKDFMESITETIKLNDIKIIDDVDNESAKKYKPYGGPGPYVKGSYNQIKSFELDFILNKILVKTNFGYSTCLDKGLEVFFGKDFARTNKIKDIAHKSLVTTSPGYWLSVSNSILKSFDQITSAVEAINSSFADNLDEKLINLLDVVSRNKIIQFANTAAIVGDIFLKHNNGLKDEEDLFGNPMPFDVDKIKTTPGTRISKNRENDGDDPLQLSWRQSSIPSMYILPRNVLRASIMLDNVVKGSNPVRGMLASKLVKHTYFDRTHDGSGNRIPNDVVKRLENELDAEYVPFYIQDLRTNEIISFHAFLSTLSDSINPSFTETTGYGRLDPVQTYNTTTRSVTVGFTLIATSKEDFDMMYYKINKLVTLLYPQWTQGTKLTTSGEGDSFVMPFSQVIGASPIVRLRVGDIIKSNYSKFNLARTFGIGDPYINPMIKDDILGIPLKLRKAGLSILNTVQNVVSEIYYVVMGTPLQYIPQQANFQNKLGNSMANLGLKVARNFLSKYLINGFVNPIGAQLVLNKLKNPNSTSGGVAGGIDNLNIGELGLANTLITPQRGKIKANMVKGYLCEETGEYINFSRPIDCIIISNDYDTSVFEKSKGKIIEKKNHAYKVKVIDKTGGINMFGQHLLVSHSDIIPDISDIFTQTAGSLLFGASPFSLVDFLEKQIKDDLLNSGLPSDLLSDTFNIVFGSESTKFMQKSNNPFVRAYETTMGRGLAGVLGDISFNWLENDINWEIDYNSRAPIGCNISLSLKVIHDIAPGLDHSGYNRAPLYNVGDIMKEISGDVHEEDDKAEFNYRKSNLKFKTGK